MLATSFFILRYLSAHTSKAVKTLADVKPARGSKKVGDRRVTGRTTWLNLVRHKT